jgi:hypothetical protein
MHGADSCLRQALMGDNPMELKIHRLEAIERNCGSLIPIP